MQNGLKRIFFYEEKNFGSKGKLSISYENIEKNVQVFNGYHRKNVNKYFCIFFCFRRFCVFFHLKTKTIIFWLRSGG